MFKTTAINMLGGTTTAAAQAMGISYQAVDKWPHKLPSRIADRVLGVAARKRFADLAAEHADAELADSAQDDALGVALTAGLCVPNTHWLNGEGGA